MRSTSSFRSAALAAGVLLFTAFPGRAQTYKCVYNDCGAVCDCTTPDGCSCATGGGGGGGYESRPMTEEEIARKRAFWGDGSSYHVRRDDLPSLFDLLRGKRDSSKRQRKSAIRAGALSAMAAHQALGQGNWPLAESNYRLAIAAGAADRSTLKGLGYVLQRKGDIDAAISTLEIAVRSFPRDKEAKSLLVSALDAKAYALFVKGDFVGAEAAWKRALEVDPDDAQAKANLPRCADYRSRTAHRLVPGGPAIPDGQWGKPVARPQPAARLALPGTLGQAADAEAEGREAATASSDEEAKHRASLVFDTPVKGAVIVSLPPISQAPPAPQADDAGEPSPAAARVEAPASSALTRVSMTLEKRIAEADREEAELAAQPATTGVAARRAAIAEDRAKLEEQKATVATIHAAVRPPPSPSLAPAPSVGPSTAAPVLASVVASILDLSLRSEYGFTEDRKAQSRIDRLLAELCPALELDCSRISVRLLGTTRVTRPRRFASATLDGHLYVELAYLGAVPPPSDDELSFVLAHELGHLKERHGERALASMGSSDAQIGELQTNNPRVRALAEQAMNATVKSSHETEADENALDAILKCGRTSKGMEEFFRRLEPLDKRSGSAVDSKVFDHPSAASRRAHLRKRLTP